MPAQKGRSICILCLTGGANLSCVNPDNIEDIAVLEPLGRIRKLATASEGLFIDVKYRVTLDFYINDVLL